MSKRIIVFTSAPKLTDREIDVVVTIYTTNLEQYDAVWHYLADSQKKLLQSPDSMPQPKHCEITPNKFVLALQQHGGHRPQLFAEEMHSYFTQKYNGRIETVYTDDPKELAGIFKFEEEA